LEYSIPRFKSAYVIVGTKTSAAHIPLPAGPRILAISTLIAMEKRKLIILAEKVDILF